MRVGEFKNFNKMEKAKKLFNAIIILFVSTFITTSCSENNKNKEQKSLDTEANLFGKWEYEEMGIKMNIEILENKTFIWSSAYGNYGGKWEEKNDTLLLNPNDKLQSKIILINDKKGKLIELTEGSIKPIYTKIN